MISHRGSAGWWCLRLLAVLIVCSVPALANAESLYFRNECKYPVVVQGVSIVRGVLRRDRPYMLKPGDSTPGIMLPGDKIITVYDAKVPNRVLFQGAISAGAKDQYFGIVPDKMPPRVRMERRQPPRDD
jgi:hypothetical protein